nr:GNAT family protein [uncultured Solibaculum sp.]
MPYLTGQRVVLREYRQEDIEPIQGWVNDPDITRFLDGAVFLYPRSIQQTRSFVEENARAGGPNFVIAHRHSDEYIGQLELSGVDYRHGVASLGIVVGGKGCRGKGYGSEAIGLALEFAFRQMNLNRVELWVREDNDIALKCYRSCGFVEEGRRRSCYAVDGVRKDLVLMGILQDEWERRL